MKFKEFYKLLDEAFSNWEYRLPEDKEEQIYDFYTLTGLQTPSDDKLKTAYNDALKKIVNELTKKMKSAIFWAVSAEFRHVLDHNTPESFKRFYKDSEYPIKFIKDYIQKYKTFSGPFSGLYQREMGEIRKRFEDSSRSYQEAYKATKAALESNNMEIEEFMDMADKMFSGLSWASSYGGEPWAQIARGYLMLEGAESLDDKIIAIDHAYDLQHNTDTVFNKLKSYYKEGTGYKWIKKALDHKRDVDNVIQIIDYASAGLKPFAMAVIKDTTGMTYELFKRKEEAYTKRLNEVKRIAKNHYPELHYTAKLDGSVYFYLDKEKTIFHREDGWAVMDSEGTKYWYKSGKLHNSNGPAIVYSDKMQKEPEYFLKGEEVSKEEWEERIYHKNPGLNQATKDDMPFLYHLLPDAIKKSYYPKPDFLNTTISLPKIKSATNEDKKLQDGANDLITFRKDEGYFMWSLVSKDGDSLSVTPHNPYGPASPGTNLEFYLFGELFNTPQEWAEDVHKTYGFNPLIYMPDVYKTSLEISDEDISKITDSQKTKPTENGSSDELWKSFSKYSFYPHYVQLNITSKFLSIPTVKSLDSLNAEEEEIFISSADFIVFTTSNTVEGQWKLVGSDLHPYHNPYGPAKINAQYEEDDPQKYEFWLFSFEYTDVEEWAKKVEDVYGTNPIKHFPTEFHDVFDVQPPEAGEVTDSDSNFQDPQFLETQFYKTMEAKAGTKLLTPDGSITAEGAGAVSGGAVYWYKTGTGDLHNPYGPAYMTFKSNGELIDSKFYLDSEHFSATAWVDAVKKKYGFEPHNPQTDEIDSDNDQPVINPVDGSLTAEDGSKISKLDFEFFQDASFDIKMLQQGASIIQKTWNTPKQINHASWATKIPRITIDQYPGGKYVFRSSTDENEKHNPYGYAVLRPIKDYNEFWLFGKLYPNETSWAKDVKHFYGFDPLINKPMVDTQTTQPAEPQNEQPNIDPVDGSLALEDGHRLSPSELEAKQNASFNMEILKNSKLKTDMWFTPKQIADASWAKKIRVIMIDKYEEDGKYVFRDVRYYDVKHNPYGYAVLYTLKGLNEFWLFGKLYPNEKAWAKAVKHFYGFDPLINKPNITPNNEAFKNFDGLYNKLLESQEDEDLMDLQLEKYGDSVRRKYLQQGIDEDIIDSYINQFNEIRKAKPKQLFDDIPNVTVPKNQRNNIDLYKDFHQLETVVDYIKGQRQLPTTEIKDEENKEANIIYSDKDLKIYRADSAQQCINARGKWPYKWCVAARSDKNLYNTYRYKDHEPTFYFVKDTKLTPTNKYHFFVLQVTKNNKYIVTSALNDGDKEMSWEEIVKLQPKLEGKQDLFVHIPIPQEQKEKMKQYSVISDQDFKNLSYEEKKEFLEMVGHNKMTDAKFEALPDDLKNMYIGFGVGLSDEMFSLIENNKKLVKRYKDIIDIKVKESFKNVYVDFNSNEKKIIDEILRNNPPKEWTDGISDNISKHGRPLGVGDNWAAEKLESGKAPQEWVDAITKHILDNGRPAFFALNWAKQTLASGKAPQEWIDVISNNISEEGYPPEFARTWVEETLKSGKAPKELIDGITNYISVNKSPSLFFHDWAKETLDSGKAPQEWIDVIINYILEQGYPQSFAKDWVYETLKSGKVPQELIDAITQLIINGNGYVPEFAFNWVRETLESGKAPQEWIDFINNFISEMGYPPSFGWNWYFKKRTRNESFKNFDELYNKLLEDQEDEDLIALQQKDSKFHASAGDNSRFWGNQGAGVLVYCESTDRYLLGLRSPYVNEPNTWGTIGGKIDDDDDDPMEAARRELVEETGYRGDIELEPIDVFESEGFRFHNFLGKVPEEFTPTISWETSEFEWFHRDEFPDNLHFGLKRLLPAIKRMAKFESTFNENIEKILDRKIKKERKRRNKKKRPLPSQGKSPAVKGEILGSKESGNMSVPLGIEF